jgi:uncharacterized protein YraI
VRANTYTCSCREDTGSVFGTIALLALIAVIASVAFRSGPDDASATTPVSIQLTADVNVRPAPNTSQTRITLLAAGTSPAIVCFTHGESIDGDDIWLQVEVAGQTGYYSGYYDTAADNPESDLTSRYGIPPCEDAAAG